MNLPLPDPLHPSIIHFPIAFIILGVLAALISLVGPRRFLPGFTAVILLLGALGAGGAFVTGHQAEKQAIIGSETTRRLVEEHEEWGERTFIVAGIAAVFSVAAVLATRWARLGAALRVVTLLAALAAAFCVLQAGHYGGRLVYEHGVGVKNPR